MAERRIIKSTFTLTVLHDEKDNVTDIPPALLIKRINDGPMVATAQHIASTPLPANKVKDELIAIGNDGTFFSDLDDDDIF